MRDRLHQIYTALGTTVKTYYKIKDDIDAVVSETKDAEDYQQIKESFLGLNAVIEENSVLNQKRTELMDYLLCHINILGQYIESPTALTGEAAKILKNQLVKLVINLQRVLKAHQKQTIEAHHNDRTVLLKGCIIGYLGALNDSGMLIQTLIFPALNLTIHSTFDEIEQIINVAVNVHQYPFLLERVKRLEEQNLSIQNQLATHTAHSKPEAVDVAVTTQPELDASDINTRHQRPITNTVTSRASFFGSGLIEAVLHMMNENNFDSETNGL